MLSPCRRGSESSSRSVWPTAGTKKGETGKRFERRSGHLRRANLHKFPYGIFYVQRKDHLFVLGVVHHARDPRVWKRRW
jgi:hypothetical protein